MGAHWMQRSSALRKCGRAWSGVPALIAEPPKRKYNQTCVPILNACGSLVVASEAIDNALSSLAFDPLTFPARDSISPAWILVPTRPLKARRLGSLPAGNREK